MRPRGPIPGAITSSLLAPAARPPGPDPGKSRHEHGPFRPPYAGGSATGAIEFWEAAKEERLLIKHCLDCDAYSYYPRPLWPKCWSEQVVWYQAGGAGSLYTWSVIYSNDMPPFRDRVPYVAAIVDLAEGPRMMTNVVDCPFDELQVGMALQVTFQPISDEFTIPVFVRA